MATRAIALDGEDKGAVRSAAAETTIDPTNTAIKRENSVFSEIRVKALVIFDLLVCQGSVPRWRQCRVALAASPADCDEAAIGAREPQKGPIDGASSFPGRWVGILRQAGTQDVIDASQAAAFGDSLNASFLRSAVCTAAGGGRTRSGSCGERAIDCLVCGRPRCRVCTRPLGTQAVVPVLGRVLVPAVQPGEGDAVQARRFHRALQAVRPGVRRWRPAQRAEAGRPLPGARLSDDDPVRVRRSRDHAAAGRNRSAAVFAGARARPRDRPIGTRDAGDRPGSGRIQADGRGLDAARQLRVGHR